MGRQGIFTQRGAGTIGCMLLALAVGGGMYAGYQLYMPEVRNSSLMDRLTEVYPFFARETPEAIRKRVIDVARDFDVALSPEQIKVRIEGNQLTLDIDYTKVVDLKVWEKRLSYHIHRRGPY